MEKYDELDGCDLRTRYWNNSVRFLDSLQMMPPTSLSLELRRSFFVLCWSRDDLLGGAVCFRERALLKPPAIWHSICKASVAWVRACASPPQTATSVLNEGNQARFLAVIGDQRYNPHRSSSPNNPIIIGKDSAPTFVTRSESHSPSLIGSRSSPE